MNFSIQRSILSVFLAFFLHGQTAMAGICLAPPHPKKIDRQLYKKEPGGASMRNGLARHTNSAGARAERASEGTMNILAIRVEFQPESPDNPKTTGNGLINLTGIPKERYWLDDTTNARSYPHDRAYFNRYMKALHNYYWDISDRQLDLAWDVAPFNEAGAYRLAKPQSYYSLWNGSESFADIGPGLVNLLHDAIVAADADPDYRMADYDAYILFHAGPGREVDIKGDTPGDIWSAFIPLNDLRQIIAHDDPSYKGIPVDGGAYYVTEGLVAPETNNQDEYYIGLQGSLFHEFGHQLGLPDLYDTSGYSIGVATWDLMGSGGNVDNGYFPAAMSAWSKYFLGWLEPTVITQNGDYTVSAGEFRQSAHPQVYKIPINSHEYFLVENRKWMVNPTHRCPNCPPENFDEDNFDGFLRNQDTGDSIAIYSEKSTIVWASDHDFFLSGEGMLIWHIDDDVIEGNMLTNTVNYNVPRGVDLEEADGINDDLDPSYFLDAYYGGPNDPFFAGNNSEFAAQTLPSSYSNNGSDSHITIKNISAAGLQMTFRVEFDWKQPGFPVAFGGRVGANSLNHGDIDGDGKEEIVLTTTTGALSAFNSDGSPHIPGMANGTIFKTERPMSSATALFDLDFDRDLEILATSDDGHLYAWQGEKPFWDNLDFSIVFAGKLSSPVISMNKNSDPDIFVTSTNGFLYRYRYSHHTNEEPFLEFPIFCEPNLIGEPAVVDLTGEGDIDLIAVASASGKIYAFEPDGNPVPGFPLNLGHPISAGLIAGDIDRNYWKEIIAVTEDGYVFAIRHDGSIVNGFPVRLTGAIHATPALADMDGNGFLDIIIPNGVYHVSILNGNGTLMSEWPNEFDQYTWHPTEPLTASPLIADIDGDNDLEVVLATWDQNIHAWHHDGRKVDGFPLALGGDAGGTPMIFNMDDDPNMELVAASDDGWLHAWELPSKTGVAPWPQFRKDAALTGQFGNNELLPINGPAEILAALYVYPNPAKDTNPKIRYRLGQPGTVTINIYNAAGDLISELQGPRDAVIDNEVEWDVTGIASGIYFAQVTVHSGSERVHRSVKVAVTK